MAWHNDILDRKGQSSTVTVNVTGYFLKQIVNLKSRVERSIMICKPVSAQLHLTWMPWRYILPITGLNNSIIQRSHQSLKQRKQNSESAECFDRSWYDHGEAMPYNLCPKNWLSHWTAIQAHCVAVNMIDLIPLWGSHGLVQNKSDSSSWKREGYRFWLKVTKPEINHNQK